MRILAFNAASKHHEVREQAEGGILGFGIREHLSRRSYIPGSHVIIFGRAHAGSKRLVFMARSPTAGTFLHQGIDAPGTGFHAAGFDAVSISGRAASPAALIIKNVDEYIDVRLVPTSRQELFDFYKTGGVTALNEHLLARYGQVFANDACQVLSCGPAAFLTAMGSVSSAEGKCEVPQVASTSTGGFGSALVQEHNIFAVLIGGNVSEALTGRQVHSAIKMGKAEAKARSLGLDADDAVRMLEFIAACAGKGLLLPSDAGVQRFPADRTGWEQFSCKFLESVAYSTGPLAQAFARGLRSGIQELSRTRWQRQKGDTSFHDLAAYIPFGASGYVLGNEMPFSMDADGAGHFLGSMHEPRAVGRHACRHYLHRLSLENIGVRRIPDDTHGKEETNPQADSRMIAQFIHAYHERARARPVAWESGLQVNLLVGLLEEAEQSGFANPKLDRWLAAFRENRVAASHDYWNELMQGWMREISGVQGSYLTQGSHD